MGRRKTGETNMATKVLIGETGQGVVNASNAIPKNTAVCFDANGLLRMCAAGDKPVGVCQDAFAVNTVATFYRCRGNQLRCLTSGTIAAGDLVKMTTGGAVIADTTSGSTALSVNTVGQAIEAAETDGYADIIFF
jgi:hypothetical protein